MQTVGRRKGIVDMTEQQPARRLSDKIRHALDHASKFGRDEVAKHLRLLYESVMAEEQEHHRLSRRREDPPDKPDGEGA